MRLFFTTCAVAALTATVGHAASFSFTGNFSRDDDVQLFNFSVGSTSSVTLRTYSYAGGTQADGNVVEAGGFDPILALFDSSGALIDENDDGSGLPEDPNTGASYDTELTTSLGMGNYTVSVMQYDNFAAGANLTDGFERDGQGNFTSSFDCDASAFCDVTGDERTNAWAFDVLNVDTADQPAPSAIPVPAALPLLLGGLFALGLFRRRA